jgi:hypothetical protein
MSESRRAVTGRTVRYLLRHPGVLSIAPSRSVLALCEK